MCEHCGVVDRTRTDEAVEDAGSSGPRSGPARRNSALRVADGSGERPRSDTSERILAAALSRFAERGVEATSLDSLAADIGVRKQTILYWFPSKDRLLESVIDHAVDELGTYLSEAVAAEPGSFERRVAAAVDATFRLGRSRPELLALLREVARVGPTALGYLRQALDPLLDTAVHSIGGAQGGGRASDEQARRALLAAGSRVVGLATEAEIRAAVGLPPDLVWLRNRRSALISEVTAALGSPRIGPVVVAAR
ncbi:MAG: TetR/AcrR family transcriptional regulator [Microthrixaceae bacterium]|jgi:TetR/AcrR family transcriptional regulator|nr:TetR/AcrR family transcriptional regulator [Microthrixaceae bacterium]